VEEFHTKLLYGMFSNRIFVRIFDAANFQSDPTREEGLVVHKGAETGHRIHTVCHTTMVKRTELGTKH